MARPRRRGAVAESRDEDVLSALRCAKRFIEVNVHDTDTTNEMYQAYRSYLAAVENLPQDIQDELEG